VNPTRRLAALRIGFVAAIAAAPLLIASAAPAATATPTATASLGGWNVNADADAVDIVIDNATGLAGIHPFTEAELPIAQSTFATGPFGSALASVFWPGSAGGNFGSLSGELSIPPQLQPLLSKLNDPVKADAQYPSGPATSTYPTAGSNPAVEMRSTAAPTGTTATAALADENLNNIISFSSAKATSTSTATTTAKGTATSDFNGISLLGLIDIASVTSTATATSDGHNSTGTTVTHLGQVTVAGQTTSIGSNGLILPNFNNLLPGVLAGLIGPTVGQIVQDALHQVVAALGITVTELPSTQTHNAASQTVSSGGLSVKIDPPAAAATTLETAFQTIFKYIPLPPQAAIIPTLPGLLQGATITITIGHSTAAAAASPPFNNTFTPTPPNSPGAATYPSGGGGGLTTAAVAGSTIPATPGQFIPGSNPTSSSSGATTPSYANLPSSSPNAGGTSSTPSIQQSKLIDLSSPLGAGAVVLGLAAAAALALGLFRLARHLLPDDTAPICPLGHDNP
jgi:hypothetical protein